MTAKPKRKSKRKGSSKEATREALIASGMALFAKRGLDGPSLDDICAYAGLTRGAFYVHFADRDDFLVAVMDVVGKAILSEIFEQGDAGIAQAVSRFVEASASGRYPLMPKGGIRPHQVLDACARLPVLRKRYLELVAQSTSHLESLVRDGQSRSVVRSDVDPPHAAVLLMTIVIGAQTLTDLGLPLQLPELATEVLRVFAPPAFETSARAEG